MTNMIKIILMSFVNNEKQITKKFVFLCNNPTITYMIEVFGFWIIIFVITTLIGYNSLKKRDI